MPMREECKHFQSRTYPSGEVARFCVLDLAPEAPWRCPDDCTSYARRLADAGWVHGSLVEPALQAEPSGANESGEEIADLLDRAEDIVNAVAADAKAEAAARFDKEGNAGTAPRNRGPLSRLNRRLRRPKPGNGENR